MFEVAYVAAVPREVQPLLRQWTRRTNSYTGRNFDFFENGDRVLVCGGIGPEAARRASEAVVSLYGPQEIVSIGFAGALDTTLRVGDLLEPATVIDSRDGSRNSITGGSGVLVSFSVVAGKDQKQRLAKAYSAQAVDMEAAAVAKTAAIHGLRFRAIKVVSDESDFAMPPMDRFVNSDGGFRTSSLVAYCAFRPQFWGAIARLARNSAKAARVLVARLGRDSSASTRVSTSSPMMVNNNGS
jgi:adenosylhomocysteine nucleosidase